MPRSTPRLALVTAPIATLMLAASALTASAVSDNWHVSRVSGRAWIASADGQTSELSTGMDLPAGATLSTGSGARVMLVRGTETMLVGPKSVLAVSEHPSEGLTTTVLEKAGAVQFDVEKRNVRYFSVETPMLAAVVKGTHFTVSVDRARGGVQVARGTVQVTALATGQVSDVSEGQRARVNGRGLSVGGAGHPSISVGTPRAAIVSALATTAPTTAPTAQFTPAELSAVASVSATTTTVSAAAPAPASTQAASAPAASGSSQADHSSSATSTPASFSANLAASTANQTTSSGGLLSAIAKALSGPNGKGGPQAGMPNGSGPQNNALVTALRGLLAQQPGLGGPAAAPPHPPTPAAPPAPTPGMAGGPAGVAQGRGPVGIGPTGNATPGRGPLGMVSVAAAPHGMAGPAGPAGPVGPGLGRGR